MALPTACSLTSAENLMILGRMPECLNWGLTCARRQICWLRRNWRGCSRCCKAEILT